MYLDFVFFWNFEYILCFKFEQLKKENFNLDRGSILKSVQVYVYFQIFKYVLFLVNIQIVLVFCLDGYFLKY